MGGFFMESSHRLHSDQRRVRALLRHANVQAEDVGL